MKSKFIIKIVFIKKETDSSEESDVRIQKTPGGNRQGRPQYPSLIQMLREPNPASEDSQHPSHICVRRRSKCDLLKQQFSKSLKTVSILNNYCCILNVWMFCLHIYLCIICLPGVHRGQMRASDPIKLKLMGSCEPPCRC